MNVSEKYIEALKLIDDWVIVSEWAKIVGEKFPELLTKANDEASNQANKTTGINQLAARISSEITRGAYSNQIEIDTSEKPRKVKFIPEFLRVEHDTQETEEDVAPLRRDEIVKLANDSMGQVDKYRTAEFETISKQLKQHFGLEFEVDHSIALLNKDKPGKHHPDNFQLILKAHNAKKNNANWERFSLEEQIEYIETAIKLQGIVSSRFRIEMEGEVLGSLIERLSKVYN